MSTIEKVVEAMSPNRATITVRELGEVCGISYDSANELTRREGFPVIRLGRKKIIPKDSLIIWLNEQKETY